MVVLLHEGFCGTVCLWWLCYSTSAPMVVLFSQDAVGRFGCGVCCNKDVVGRFAFGGLATTRYLWEVGYPLFPIGRLLWESVLMAVLLQPTVGRCALGCFCNCQDAVGRLAFGASTATSLQFEGVLAAVVPQPVGRRAIVESKWYRALPLRTA